MNLVDTLSLFHPQDNILVYFHGDADGGASAALIVSYIKDVGASYRLYTPESGDPHIDDSILDIAKDFNRVIFLDVGHKPVDLLEKLGEQVNVLFIDHHKDEKPLKINNIEYYNPANEGKKEPVSLTVYNAIKELGDYEYLCWVALIGIVGDKEEELVPDIIEKTFELYPNLRGSEKHGELSIVRFFVSLISCGRAYYRGEGAILAVELLLKAAENKRPGLLLCCSDDADKLVESRRATNRVVKNLVNLHTKKAEIREDKNLVFYPIESPLYIQNYLAGVLRNKYENWVVVVVNTGLKKDMAMAEFRTTRKDIDLRSLAQKCIYNIDNSDAGGHPEAAGCQFPPGEIDTFRDNLISNL